MQPDASITLLGEKSAGMRPMLMMRPAASATSQTLSRLEAGSMTRPFLMRIFIVL